MKGKSNAGVESVRPCEAYARPRTQARKVAIKRKTLSEEEKSSILACHGEGMSNRSIANSLPVDLLHTLVDSMPKRCLAVIKSKGWPTKY